MCVIITQPKGAYLSKEIAKAAWKANPDGGGFAYTTDAGEIVVEKRMTFDAFWRAFETARAENRDQDFLVHFRIATHGEVCLANTHPFVVNENTVMAHNGIIHSVPKDPTDQDRSDTRMFVDTVLPHLETTWLDSPFLRKAIADEIGWSKLAFLTTDERLEKRLYIINESSGAHARGMWFSNKKGLDFLWPKPERAVYPPKREHSSYTTGKAGASSQGANRRAGGQSYGSGQTTSQSRTTGKSVTTTFGSSYPDDWTPRPDEPGISNEEQNTRWMEIAEEHSKLIELREAFLKLGKVSKQVTYHPGTHRFYCKKCSAELDTDGACLCWDALCMICEDMLPFCGCQSPRPVDIRTGESLEEGRVFA